MVGDVHDVLAGSSMDGDALASGDVAADRVTRYGLAALGDLGEHTARCCIRRNSLSSTSLPLVTFSSRRSFLNQTRIFWEAPAVLTKPSQSRLGPCGPLEVRISTMSPFSSWWSSGTIRPFALAPI